MDNSNSNRTMASEGARAQRTVVPVTTTLYGMEFSAHSACTPPSHPALGMPRPGFGLCVYDEPAQGSIHAGDTQASTMAGNARTAHTARCTHRARR